MATNLSMTELIEIITKQSPSQPGDFQSILSGYINKTFQYNTNTNNNTNANTNANINDNINDNTIANTNNVNKPTTLHTQREYTYIETRF